ncbi:hypothetical protein ES703_51465 [subsurface metagenome]
MRMISASGQVLALVLAPLSSFHTHGFLSSGDLHNYSRTTPECHPGIYSHAVPSAGLQCTGNTPNSSYRFGRGDKLSECTLQQNARLLSAKEEFPQLDLPFQPRLPVAAVRVSKAS